MLSASVETKLAKYHVFIFTISYLLRIIPDSDFDFTIELLHQTLNEEPASVIDRALNILRQSGNFTNFLPISHARVPILKCCHLRTGYQCDINFSSAYGMLNSRIVARLLRFDPRIYDLATILKYWAKVHDCVGQERISNYALVWMLIFYLQSLSTPIVPPIMHFQLWIQPYYVNGYNFAFDERIRNTTTNQSSCYELLKGFFRFYADFKFKDHFICPLNGKAFRKSDVWDRKVPEFQRYFDWTKQKWKSLESNKNICIQDPFEITHSIPGIICNAEFQRIIWKFEYAADIIDAELRSNGESANLFLSLFDADKFTQHCELQKTRQNTNK